jgi:hypothetical protein
MISPYKFTSADSNYFEISDNVELAEKIKKFFQDPCVEYLWSVTTKRQKMAAALGNTSMFPLRYPVTQREDIPTTTSAWNQITNLKNSTLFFKLYPIFKETVDWLETALKEKGVNKVEFGRIFFSKHYPNSKIDIHTDKGAYFDYYDRFHFVIDQTDNQNIFYIRDNPILLQTGKLYWVNNHVPHWLENNSSKDRINLIIDARLL